MGKIKRLVGDTAWYGVSSIAGRMMTYFLVPLYTTVFSPREYGIVTEFYAYTAFLYPMFTYGLETAYFRYANKDENGEPKLFNLAVSSLLVSSLLLSFLLFAFGKELVIFLEFPGKEIVLYWLATILGVDAIVTIPFARLRFQNKPKKFATIRLVNISLTVFLNLFFLVFCINIFNGRWFAGLQPFMIAHFDFEFKAKYIFLSNLISNSLLLLFLFKEFKGFRFSFNFQKFKPILLYASPLLFMGLAGATNEMLSRSLLKYWLPDGFYSGQTSLEALGIFGACYKLSVFMMLGVQAFRYAAEPFFFSQAGNSKSPQLFANVMTGFTIFNAFLFMAISMNLELIGVIFLRNPVYREGLYVVPFLLMAYLFNGIYYNLSVWYKVTDKTIYSALITIFGAVFTVVLNYLLIPVMGYYGSSLVTLGSYFSMALVSYWIGQKHYPVPYQIGKIMAHIGIVSVLTYIFYNINTGTFLLNIVVRNLAQPLYLVVVYLMERKHLSGRVFFGMKFS